MKKIKSNYYDFKYFYNKKKIENYFISMNFERGAPHLGHLTGGQSGSSPLQVQPQTVHRHFAILFNLPIN